MLLTYLGIHIQTLTRDVTWCLLSILVVIGRLFFLGSAHRHSPGSKKLHAFSFFSLVGQLLAIHLDVVIFTKASRPEEQSVVPFLTDPAISVLVSLKV